MGENHGKNGLLCTDFLIRHIWQLFEGESDNVWSGLKTGDWEAQRSAEWQFPTDFPLCFLMFHLLFPQFLRVFPMFPLFFPVYCFRFYAQWLAQTCRVTFCDHKNRLFLHSYSGILTFDSTALFYFSSSKKISSRIYKDGNVIFQFAECAKI